MSNYNIGQYRYSDQTEYLTYMINGMIDVSQQDPNGDYKYYDYNQQTQVYDLKIDFDFQGLQTYYLVCPFLGFGKGITQEFVVKLKSNDTNREQIIKTYNMGDRTSETSIGTIMLAFTPKTRFHKIVFELKRGKDPTDEESLTRKLVIPSNRAVKLATVNNILTNLSNIDSIFKVGIQGPSDLIVCINGEPIRLGVSEMFEIHKDDFKIYSIGFIPPTATKTNPVHFIMDYCY